MKKYLVLFSLVIGFIIGSSAHAQTSAEGMLIKSSSNTAVYYVGDDGKRHAFPNSRVYFSWYKDFSKVQVVSDFELSLLPLGKNVLYRSGSRLIKTRSVNEVYAVGPWGELRNIATEDVAIVLYGDNWAKLVDDIDISFFFDYSIVGVIDYDGENLIYPRGSLIHNDGLTWVVDSTAAGVQTVRPISGDAWQLNQFDDLITYKYTGSVKDQFPVGLPMYGKEQAFTCVFCDFESYERVSIENPLEFTSQTGEYEITLAPGWGVNFYIDDIQEEVQAQGGAGPLDVILLAEKEVSVAGGPPQDSFIIWRWDKNDFNSIHELFSDLVLEGTGQQNAEIYFGGSHLLDSNKLDIAVFRDSSGAPEGTEERWLEWDRLIEDENYFYQIHFFTYYKSLESHIDVMNLVFESFKVNEIVIIEELVEEPPVE